VEPAARPAQGPGLTAGERGPTRAPRVPAAVLRLRQLAVCLLLTALAFSQSPGQVASDTKLDLTADPAAFLGRALHLWNPTVAFGQLQNQAYGYLFPMGPFHLLGLEAGLPAWVVQRAWWSLLLVAAFLGTVRLAARLGVGTPLTRVLGALAYALSPRIMTELGGISSELMPMVLLPWTLVPLVGPAARRAPLRAAARSGTAVLLMGAVNATATLAVLPLPAVFLLAGLRTRQGRRLAACSLGALLLAAAWWAGPLLLQGAYSLPFLDWIETGAVTTRPTSLLSTLRGTSHWLPYLAVDGRPWWRSGWLLVTSPVVVLDTAVVAALGLAGLATRGMPARRRLAAAAALGLLAVTLGHVGALTPPWAPALQGLLDGPLAPFRNLHKFDPLLRLPLALGLAHLLTLSPERTRRPAALLVAVALVGGATPLLAGQLAPSGPYAALPGWWQDTADWLDARADEGSALLVPAAGAGEYAWGRPLDEPLQALTRRTRWAVRDAVPLGGPGLTRLLDGIGERLDTGTASPGLAPLLQRMGVRYLVVRNDLDLARTGAPRPVLVHQAVEGSPGLTRVVAFGPSSGGGARGRVVTDRALDVPYRPVEVYEVGPAQPVVSVLPQAGTQLLSGGPESLLQLADRGLLGPATVLAGDGHPGQQARRVVSDGNRRRERDFGQVRGALSPTRTAQDPASADQPVADYEVVQGAGHQSVAELLGAREVLASSSASDPHAVLERSPAAAPFAAFDGDLDTSWVSGSTRGAAGSWVQLDLDAPRDLTGASVAVGDDEHAAAAVEVRTDTGTATTRLDPRTGLQPLAVPPGSTGSLRVTVTAVRGEDGPGVLARIADVALPGVRVTRTLVAPHDSPVGAGALLVFDRAAGAQAGCVSTRGRGAVCSPDLERAGEEEVRLDRSFTLDEAQSLPLSGTAAPVPGPALEALLDRGARVRATASSRSVADPRGRPAAVLDGDRATAWVAAGDDEHPELTVSFDRPRTVDQVRLVATRGAARPTRVRLELGGTTRTLDVPESGVLRFPAVRADRLTVQVLERTERYSASPYTGALERLPVGLADVVVPGLPAAVPSGEVPVPCGSGPPVVLDGTAYPTAALGSRADLLALRPVLLSVCAPGPQVGLAAGQHRLVGATAGALRVQGLALGAELPYDAAPVRSQAVVRWEPEHRAVDVGAGPAAWLVVHENANAGWRAELDGQELRPARIDGWQQAFVLPAGAGGRVELEYVPGAAYRRDLLVGLAAALLLVGLALPRRRRRAAAPEPGGSVRRDGPVRLPALPAGVPRLAVPLAAAAVLLLVGGAYGLLAGVLALLVRRATRHTAALAGAALLLAGVLEALAPWAGTRTPASTGTPTQALCLLALALFAAGLTDARGAARAARPAAGSAPPPAG